MGRNEKESRQRMGGKGRKERAHMSGTERSKKSTMWIVVNDRVQLNEGM